jgi:hypothetical protein
MTAAILVAGTAQADVCSSLQQQYFAAGGGGGGYSSSARPSVDIASLNRSLQSAEAAAQANRCNAGIFAGIFGAGPSPSCNSIIQQVNLLQDQIRQAYASGAAGGPRFGTIMTFAEVSPADQIRGALIANGCAVPQTGGAGGYRTVCVRSCDGYYFPIGYGVSSDRFQADAQACQAMYGGPNAAQLFVMPSGADVADATPVGGGKRYGAQPYAFAYRQTFDAACTAQLHAGAASLTTVAAPAAATTTAASTAPTPSVPRPALRPPRFEYPETLANLSGGLAPSPLAVVDAGPRRDGIRVVGAGYFNAILEQQQRAAGGPAAPAVASITQ